MVYYYHLRTREEQERSREFGRRAAWQPEFGVVGRRHTFTGRTRTISSSQLAENATHAHIMFTASQRDMGAGNKTIQTAPSTRGVTATENDTV